MNDTMIIKLTDPGAIAAPDGYLTISDITGISEKKTVYRRRDRQLIIRLTESELAEFSEKMKNSNMTSRADFIMALVRDKPIIVPDGFREIAVELKREGNNFNQYLRHAQKTNCAPSWRTSGSIDKLYSLYDRLEAMLDELKAG